MATAHSESSTASARPFYGSLEDLGPRNEYADEATASATHQRDDLKRNIATAVLADQAASLGATVDWIDSNYALATVGDKTVILAGSRSRASRLAASLVADKFLTKEFLLKHGVSTARGFILTSLDDALEFQREIDGPIVIKPRSGYGGQAVSVNLTDPDEIALAYERARKYGDVVVEEYIGNVVEFRCVSSDTECVSIVGRLLPWVAGDGHSTIRELIIEKNRARDAVPSTHKRYIPLDSNVDACLEDQSLTIDSVLPKGEIAIVRKVGGLTLGGEPFECSHLVDQSIRDFAVSAVQAIPGLRWAGVDVILTPEGKPYVVEINTSSDTLGSRFPWYGTPVNLADYMFKSRIKNAPEIETSSPRFPALARRPRPLYSASDQHSDAAHSLSTLLLRTIPDLGWNVVAKNDFIHVATSPSGREVWLQGTATIADLNIARRSGSRHKVVRTLLERSQLPRVHGTTVTSPDELAAFLKPRSSPSIAIPAMAEWGSRHAVELLPDTDVSLANIDAKHPWVVQTKLQGRRFQVIATTREALAVLGESPLDYPDLAGIATLAVKAVRAVPELRWASVTIVSPEGESKFRHLVEGMNVNPLLSRDLNVYAGTMRDVYEYILSEAS